MVVSTLCMKVSRFRGLVCFVILMFAVLFVKLNAISVVWCNAVDPVITTGSTWQSQRSLRYQERSKYFYFCNQVVKYDDFSCYFFQVTWWGRGVILTSWPDHQLPVTVTSCIIAPATRWCGQWFVTLQCNVTTTYTNTTGSAAILRN